MQALSEDEEFAELIEGDELGDDLPDLLIASLSIPQIRGFCDRAKVFIQAGRTPCPFCGGAINADGHLCPRANGYRR
jgi:uncharacterized repeat protein (TIGR03847 family)